jgi:hypothetical protein
VAQAGVTRLAPPIWWKRFRNYVVNPIQNSASIEAVFYPMMEALPVYYAYEAGRATARKNQDVAKGVT